jgi:GT2 family glycosyltransferase
MQVNEGLQGESARDASATPAPRVSVVLATYNRLDLLTRLLGQLSSQTLAPDRFEVVVVDDGSTIPVEARIDPTSYGYRLTILTQANAGPATARHAAILRARGEIIVLLDDDMDVPPTFLESHLDYHASTARKAVFGRYRPDPEIRSKPLFERYEARKWEDLSRAFAKSGTTPKGACFVSGNASFRRDDYLRVGGFELWLRRAEDNSLGYKLEEAGVELVFSDAAYSVHRSDHVSPAVWRGRAYLHGRLETRIARMHPTLAYADPMRYAFTLPLAGRVFCLAGMALPTLGERFAGAVFTAAEAADALGLERAALRATGLVYGMDYFRGMRAEAGSLRALGSACVTFLRKAAGAPSPPPTPRARGSAGVAITESIQNHADHLLRRGAHAAPLDFARDRVFLLFYEDFERDTFVRNDRHLRRLLRVGYHRLKGGQRVSGFFVWFLALRAALERAGYRVVVNDHALARRNPRYPVGIAGYPHVLDRWTLPNPAILGPGLLDHPAIAPKLMEDPRFRRYIVTCEWMREVFSRYYTDKCTLWAAGMDLEAWPDFAAHQKDLDFIVYDKLRWDRDRVVPAVLTPVVEALRARGLTYQVLRYRHYDHDEYRRLLARARGMVFLCEHETQGLAYQEAMTCNVPVLAWDNGFWLDPQRSNYEPEPVPASSVPYFSAACGERFRDAEDLPRALDAFLDRRSRYAPRRYVKEHLSYEASARTYIEEYRALWQEAQSR